VEGRVEGKNGAFREVKSVRVPRDGVEGRRWRVEGLPSTFYLPPSTLHLFCGIEPDAHGRRFLQGSDEGRVFLRAEKFLHLALEKKRQHRMKRVRECG
jgi:hypothetical protein